MKNRLQSIIAIFLVSSILISSLGCANKLTRNPVPESYVDSVEIFGSPLIRAWGDEYSPEFQADIINSVQVENKGDYPPKKPDCELSYSALAISGGGASGAFGAGILNGWSETGKRPKFKIVTGISTGALTAPFAFLGSEYDQAIKAGYTGVTTEDVAKQRSILSAFTNESLADNAPLLGLIDVNIDEKILKAVAQEHAKGRRLYIGTFNMDAQRFVIWNMGAIASSGNPGALELFRKIMIASASMPVIFPPVYVDVEIKGIQFDEMHVDGGVAAQVFFYGLMLNLTEEKNVKGCSELFVIRNGQVGPSYKQIERNLPSMIERSLLSMTKASGRNDLIRIYFLTTRDGIDFNYTAVPDDFVYFGDEAVDQEEMTALFELGYEMGLSEDIWQNKLPGLRK